MVVPPPGLRCQHCDRVKGSTPLLLNNLRIFFTKTNVSGEMVHLLVEGIYYFLHDSPPENIYPLYLQPLIHLQEEIGWEQFFLGQLPNL